MSKSKKMNNLHEQRPIEWNFHLFFVCDDRFLMGDCIKYESSVINSIIILYSISIHRVSLHMRWIGRCGRAEKEAYEWEQFIVFHSNSDLSQFQITITTTYCGIAKYQTTTYDGRVPVRMCSWNDEWVITNRWIDSFIISPWPNAEFWKNKNIISKRTGENRKERKCWNIVTHFASAVIST